MHTFIFVLHYLPSLEEYCYLSLFYVLIKMECLTTALS